MMCDKVRQGEGGSKLVQNSMTYVMDAPFIINPTIVNETASDK